MGLSGDSGLSACSEWRVRLQMKCHTPLSTCLCNLVDVMTYLSTLWHTSS